ncbi:MAG TPA: ComF family protein [Rhodospirillales bacterium]|nr:ComF family protein [Rhodospirillales bacterium]
MAQTTSSVNFAVALNLLLPPQCLGCGVLVETTGGLCGECWSAITFVGDPACARCGLPFEFADAQSNSKLQCASCVRQPTVFARARAVMAYDDASRHLILAFKHGDRTDAAPTYARWMARAGADLLDQADLIVPVPLHWSRLFSRRYNQAALLAREIGAIARKTVVPDAMWRTRRTPSQGRLGALARRRNVGGAFKVRRKHLTLLAGRRVLLIDDVMTTGATANSSARALLRAGAGAVDVLTLSRVLRPFPAL